MARPSARWWTVAGLAVASTAALWLWVAHDDDATNESPVEESSGVSRPTPLRDAGPRARRDTARDGRTGRTAPRPRDAGPTTSGIQVRVVDPAGRPVSGASLTATLGRRSDKTYRRVTATSDGHGWAFLEGITPGERLGLAITPPEESEVLAPRWLREWSLTGSGPEVGIPAGSSVQGHVVADDGRPLSGAVVSYVLPDGKSVRGVGVSEDGAFRFVNVASSETITLVAKLYGRSSPPVSVTAGESAARSVTLRVPIGPAIWISIEGGAAGLETSASIVANDGLGTREVRPILATGRIDAAGLSPTMPFVVSVAPMEDGGPCVFARGVFLNTTVLQLERVQSTSIEGELRTPPECTLESLTLIGRGLDRRVRVGANAAFRVARVPPGEWEFFAEGSLHGRRLRTAIRVTGGDRGVVVELRADR